MATINDKPFDKIAYLKSDAKVKYVIMEFLRQQKFVDILENIEEQQRIFRKIWDVKGFRQDIGEIRIEGEEKRVWGPGRKYPTFTFRTVSIPMRKRDKTREHATHHLVVGHDCRRAFLVPRKVVLESPTWDKVCSNTGETEGFYNISVYHKEAAFLQKGDDEIWRKVPYGTV